nr:hypothetical protein [Tanacetum cinerariifolium]
ISKIDEQEATESGGDDEETKSDGVSMESIFTTGSSTVTPIPSPKSIMTPSIMTTTTTASQPPIPPTPIPSDILQTLPTFTLVFCFEDRVKFLEVNFSEFMWTNQSTEAVSNILADLSEIELKKILIDKMEGNKSIQRSDEQRNLYKALVEAYDADKTILDSYRESTILKGRREEHDDQEGPSAGSDWGSKRRREGGEHASASTPSEPAIGSAGRFTTGTQSRQLTTSESAFAEEPVQTTCQMEEPSHLVFETVQKINPLFKLLSILNGSPSQGDHQHRIAIGTKLCQLLKETLSHG